MSTELVHEGKCRERQQIQHVLHYFSQFTKRKKKEFGNYWWKI